MSRVRRTVRLAAILTLGAGALLVAAPPSVGQEATPPDSQGWWWKGNGGYPVPVPSPAPTTEEGQLVVAGAPDGATGIAAVRYTLDEGEAVQDLVLEVAPGGESAATAVILACQAGSGWTGVENGPWSEKPSVDCASGAAEGTYAQDEATFTFPVGPLQFGDQLNVVLVAGTVEGAPAPLNGSSFQVVLQNPQLVTSGGGAAVPRVDAGSADGFSGGSDGFAGTSDSVASGGGSDAPTPSSGTASFAGGSMDLPSSGGTSSSSFTATPALPADEQGRTATAPVLQATNPAPQAAAAVAGGRDTKVLGLLLLAAGAAMLVVTKRPDLLGGLVGAGAAGAGGAAADEPALEGIGRFARPRRGNPPSLT